MCPNRCMYNLTYTQTSFTQNISQKRHIHSQKHVSVKCSTRPVAFPPTEIKLPPLGASVSPRFFVLQAVLFTMVHCSFVGNTCLAEGRKILLGLGLFSLCLPRVKLQIISITKCSFFSLISLQNVKKREMSISPKIKKILHFYK